MFLHAGELRSGANGPSPSGGSGPDVGGGTAGPPVEGDPGVLPGPPPFEGSIEPVHAAPTTTPMAKRLKGPRLSMGTTSGSRTAAGAGAQVIENVLSIK